MTSIDLTSEFSRADVDFYRPETIPWFDRCLACDIRRDISSGKASSRLQGVRNNDITYHFLDQHKVKLVQRDESDQYGVLEPVAGPHYRFERAVRFRVVAEDSPIKGRVTFDRVIGGRDQAEANANIFRERPDQFADVAVVTRMVRIDDWTEE